NSANKREEKFERFEFAAPAYFPLSDYDSCGMQYQRPGLVILEGMALTFEPGSSQYELTFEYEVPAVPVELRLQLMVHRAPCPANKEHTNDWFTITIPVTRLEAGRSDSPSVMQARIKGNSVALKHLCHLESSTTERQSISLELKRRGTARFGHGFDRVDRAIARQ
ncbi:MAG TPA: hypothetical protein PKD54_15350, partial [Pirellulaceae bacterium]|nr:hypothetical protein [Pirellulaceae bacterium]